MSRTEPVEVTSELLRQWQLPDTGSSKDQRGDVLVIGGAERTPGAVQLAGLAALRVGAGRLSLALAAPVAGALAVVTPEAGVAGLPVDSNGSLTGEDLDRIDDWIKSSDVLILGPGLDSAQSARALLSGVLARLGDSTSLVLDAFALGVLAEFAPLPGDLHGRLVLKPNDTEAERLLGRPLGDDLVADVSEIAARYDAVVSCSGVVADSDARSWRISFGRDGLGTSGSGDVLSGAIGGLLARGASAPQAACWATYLHSAAGERLASRVSKVGFLAREIVDRLPYVLDELT
jgi:hydroxyethylthiazole kinase-like uncharacterized protein yjeF